MFGIKTKIIEYFKYDPFMFGHLTSRFSDINLHIETSSFCNAHCSFCPNSTLQRKKNFMSDEIFDKILLRIEKENINVKNFVLHLLGEPLTDKKIFNRIHKIKTLYSNSNVRMTTNFNLADMDTIDKILESGLDEITISINSLDHDEYNHIMGLEFNKTMENIHSFIAKMRERERENKIKCNFSIVVTNENEKKLNDFEEKFLSYGNIRKIYLGKWINKDIPENYDTSHALSYQYCDTLYNTIAILSNGDYALCCFDAEGIVGLNVMDTPIRDAWHSKVIYDIRKHHQKFGKTNLECKDCSFR